MTEVPEHLLARSRERRSALGQGGGDAPAPAAASSGSDGGTAAAATPAAAAAPPVVVEAAPPPPPPPYVQAALDRKKAPKYMGPVGVAILLWAFIYAGVMFTSDEISDPVLAEGGEIYAAQCSGCHGGSGQGGTGRPLHDLLETFPDPADHIAWVTNGSPAAGTVYGANGHVSQDGWPAMPGFGSALSEEQIVAVVRYEREVINGEEPNPGLAAGGAEGSPEAGADGGGEEGAEGDPADDPSSEAESEGGDVGSGDSSSAGDDEETLTEGNESESDDSTPDDSGTGGEGETDTGE